MRTHAHRQLTRLRHIHSWCCHASTHRPLLCNTNTVALLCVCWGALQTSSETFFRTSKFYKAGDEAPPVFIVDGVSYLSIKVLGAAAAILHTTRLCLCQAGATAVMCGNTAEVASCVRRAQPGWFVLCCLVVVALQDGGVQLVATTRDNVSPSFVLEFLKRISIIIKVHAAVGVAGLLRGVASSRSVCQPGPPCIRQPTTAQPAAAARACQPALHASSCSDRCTLCVVPRAGLLWQRE